MAIRKGKQIPGSSAFRFVPATKVQSVIFEKPSGRISAYLQALQALFEKPDQLMEVDSLTARAGIYAQAKKHGIKVLFGEHGGKLYVKVLEREGPEAFILGLLADGPKNIIEIEAAMAKERRDGKAQEIMSALSSNGRVALRTVPGANTKKWFLNKESV